LLAAVGRELAALAVEDHAVDAVPRLDQVQALFASGGSWSTRYSSLA
jgi:hypothetical protein